MADLTTIAKVKEWMGIISGTDDALLIRLVAASSVFIQTTYLNRDLASAARTEKRDGTSGQMLMFSHYPVLAVSAVSVNGIAIPLSSDGAINVSGYAFDSTSIWLLGHSFSRGRRNVSLSYTAGYSPIPADIEQVCIQLCALRYREKDRIGHTSKSLGGEVVSFSTADMSADIQTALNQYRKVILE